MTEDNAASGYGCFGDGDFGFGLTQLSDGVFIFLTTDGIGFREFGGAVGVQSGELQCGSRAGE